MNNFDDMLEQMMKRYEDIEIPDGACEPDVAEMEYEVPIPEVKATQTKPNNAAKNTKADKLNFNAASKQQKNNSDKNTKTQAKTKADEEFDKMGVSTYKQNKADKPVNNKHTAEIKALEKAKADATAGTNQVQDKKLKTDMPHIEKSNVTDPGCAKEKPEDVSVNSAKNQEPVFVNNTSFSMQNKSGFVFSPLPSPAVATPPPMLYTSNTPALKDNVSEPEPADIKNEINDILKSVKTLLSRFFTSELAKKAVIFAIMVICFAGLPVLISNVGVNNKKAANNNAVSEKEEKPSVRIELEDTYNKNTEASGVINTDISYDFSTSELKSDRFETLDDLTLYIQSSQGYILSGEKQAATQLKNNSISVEEYNRMMTAYIEAADEINHLLLLNKGIYKENKKYETYKALAENMETVLCYGDTALYR